MNEVTRLLVAARGGDLEAHGRLLPLVYDELKRIAHRQLRSERSGHTLQTTALAHEAYLKLVDQVSLAAEDRAHFLGIAARAMRQVLVDYARRRLAAKRGGGWERTSLTGANLGFETNLEEILSLDDALDRLDDLDQRARQVVEYRFFAGMSEREIGTVLEVSERTVERDWIKARAWLYKEMHPEATENGS